MVPFKPGDRVVRREDVARIRGTVVEVLRDAPDGEDQLLRVYWDNGIVGAVFGRDLLSWIEKAAPGKDVARCPVCNYPLPSHAEGCRLAR